MFFFSCNGSSGQPMRVSMRAVRKNGGRNFYGQRAYARRTERKNERCPFYQKARMEARIPTNEPFHARHP
jgi:hypothetical protein